MVALTLPPFPHTSTPGACVCGAPNYWKHNHCEVCLKGSTAYTHLQELFQTLGTSENQSLLSAVTQGVAKLIGCILALFFVDRVGRKRLQIIGEWFWLPTGSVDRNP